MRTKTFRFEFTVSRAFLRDPAAERYVELAKARISRQPSAVGPRGGLYKLVTPPDGWRESDEGYYDFIRNERRFMTRRRGVYVRPDRITPDLRLPPYETFDTLTLTPVDGRVVLPGGETVETEAKYVDVPVLSPA